MKAKVTISRPSRIDERKTVTISIEDAANGINIVEVALDTADFAECITGLSLRTAKIERPPTFNMIENLGKKKEVRSIYVEKTSLYGEENRALILTRLTTEAKKPEWQGWQLGGDGLMSQQNGKKHRGYMCRYVEPGTNNGGE